MGVQARLGGLAALSLVTALTQVTGATDVRADGGAGDYEYQVVAVTGTAGLTGVKEGPSINDNGMVAFVGQISGGEGIFVGNGTAAPRNITPGYASSTRAFSLAVQIDNHDRVVAQDRKAGAPPATIVRVWDGTSTDTGTEVATGSGSASARYESVLSHPSMNENGQVVFAATTKDGRTVLAVPDAVRGFDEIPVAIPVRPMIADNGRVVLRVGSHETDPIRLYSKDLGSSETVADAAAGFTSLGRSPGTSADGRVVAFTGTLSDAGAKVLGTTAGPGVFVSVARPDGGGRVIHRVAGVGGNGVLDPGETFDDANDNGTYDLGESDQGPFASFDVDSRVSVNYTGTVAFIATSGAGRRGLYTTRSAFLASGPSDTKAPFAVTGPPALVAEQGTKIPGAGTVQDLAVHDALDDHDRGDVAFWMSTDGGGQAVIKATPTMCPGAGYADPTTSAYVNQYAAGTALTLPTAGVDPRRGGNACGPSALTMAVDAHKFVAGQANRLELQPRTATTAATAEEAATLTVASTDGFRAGDAIEVDADTQEALKITGKNDATGALTLGAPLASAHVKGERVLDYDACKVEAGLAADAPAGATSLTLDSAAGFSAKARIGVGVVRGQSTVTAVADHTITLADPMGVAFRSGSTVFDLANAAYARSVGCPPKDGIGNSFNFMRAYEYVHDVLGYTGAAVFDPLAVKPPRSVDDFLAFLDNALDHGTPVLVSTTFGGGARSAPNPYGGGHIVLFIGRTVRGDYIVKDPAGNYLKGSADAREHYRKDSCGDTVVYSRKLVRDNVALRGSQAEGSKPVICANAGCTGSSRTFTDDPGSATSRYALAIPPVAHPDPDGVLVIGHPVGTDARTFDLWLADATGRRTGWSGREKLEELPDSLAGIEPDLPSDPDAPLEGDFPGAWPYAVHVGNPDPGLHLVVRGTEAGPYRVEVLRNVAGVLTTSVVEGTVGAGETRDLGLLTGGPVDTTAPTTTATTTPAPNPAGWNRATVTVALSAEDGASGSGVAEIGYTLTGAQRGSATVPGSTASVEVSAEGVTQVRYAARDRAGNVEPEKTLVVRIDATPPVTVATPETPPNAAGWYRSGVTVRLASTDPAMADGSGGSGVVTTSYRLDGGPTTTYSGPIAIAADGVHTLSYHATDAAGNVEADRTFVVRIDGTPPTLDVRATPATLWPPDHTMRSVSVDLTDRDALSGVATPVLESVVSNEPGAGRRDDVAGDVRGWDVGSDDRSGEVRAERDGAGDGRTYSLTYSVRDRAGNVIRATCVITVPHDRRATSRAL